MHTVSRLLFGLSFLLFFAIGCQKNPSAVRATKTAAGKCDPELVKAVGAIRDLKTNIEKLQKESKDSSTQISSKASQCETLIKTFGKGQLEIAECSAADSKAKITSAEVKSLCGAELNKAGADTAAAAARAASEMKEICGDTVSSLLQKVSQSLEEQEKASQIKDEKERNQKLSTLLKDHAAVCMELYPKMPNQCKTEITKDGKKSVMAFPLGYIEQSCKRVLLQNKDFNKEDLQLPERTSATVEAVRADPAVQRSAEVDQQKLRARDEALSKLNDAKSKLEEKRAAKVQADEAARLAKVALEAEPSSEEKKTAAKEKADLATRAAEEVKAAEIAVRDLGGVVEAATRAVEQRRRTVEVAKLKLKVELVATLKEKIEKVLLEKVDTLIKVAPAAGEDGSKKTTDPATPVIAGGTVTTIKSFLEDKNEKVACRVTQYANGLKYGEAEILNVTDDETTDKNQFVNIYLKTKGDDGVAFALRCAKFSTEQVTLEEIEKAFGDTLKFVKKVVVHQPPTGEGSPKPHAPAEDAKSGSSGAPVASMMDMFNGKTLKLAMNSFIMTNKEDLDEVMLTSKTIVSGLPILGDTSGLNRNPIKQDKASKNYTAGKTVCIFTGAGPKLSEKDVDNIKAEVSHRVVLANFQKRKVEGVNHQALRIQTAAVSTRKADETDIEKASGAKFTCYKKGDVDMTLDDVRQGLQGAVNSIN